MLKKLFRWYREHLLTPLIIENQDRILRVNNEILKGLIFNNTIEGSKWFKYKSISPGRAAADYGLLFTIYRVLDSVKPKKILECGLGQSSKLIHQYASYFNAEAVTCEHDPKWIEFFNNSKEGDYPINIALFPLINRLYKGQETLSYDGIDSYLMNKKFDFIMIDGPFGSNHYSRSELIDIVDNNLSKSFCFILDDYERPGEKETGKEIENVLKKNGVDFKRVVYSSSKDHLLICSPDWSFLTTL